MRDVFCYEVSLVMIDFVKIGLMFLIFVILLDDVDCSCFMELKCFRSNLMWDGLSLGIFDSIDLMLFFCLVCWKVIVK